LHPAFLDSGTYPTLPLPPAFTAALISLCGRLRAIDRRETGRRRIAKILCSRRRLNTGKERLKMTTSRLFSISFLARPAVMLLLIALAVGAIPARVSAQTLTVDVPDGGESWGATQPRMIRWHGSASIISVKIEYSTDGGSSWSLVVASTPNDGVHTWTVPTTPSTQCRVKISDATTPTIYDISDADFTIFTSIAVDVPDGGEAWEAGETRVIAWHGSHPSSSPVKIEYSTNGGTVWTTIEDSTPNDGSHPWVVPTVPSTQCRVRVSDATTGTPADMSDNDFTIFTSIAVDVPDGGEAWEAGETRVIAWHGSHPSSSPVKIEYSTDGGTAWTTIEAGTPNDGSHPWVVPAAPSSQCRVRVSDAATGTPTDMSDNSFTIFTSITVDLPNGGEVWGVGDPQYIVWHGSSAPASPVTIEYSTDSGSSWSPIEPTTDNDGSYLWTVPDTPSTQCRVRIAGATNGTPSDMSDSDFTITRRGNIIVEKQTEPDGDPTNFAFSGDANGSISDGGEIVEPVLPGVYSSTEVLADGWYLADISCEDPSHDSFGETATGKATFNVASGETVRCTFTNTRPLVGGFTQSVRKEILQPVWLGLSALMTLTLTAITIRKLWHA
jgi:hypothetical protein